MKTQSFHLFRFYNILSLSNKIISLQNEWNELSYMSDKKLSSYPCIYSNDVVHVIKRVDNKQWLGNLGVW